jgi:hypothetical protein
VTLTHRIQNDRRDSVESIRLRLAAIGRGKLMLGNKLLGVTNSIFFKSQNTGPILCMKTCQPLLYNVIYQYINPGVNWLKNGRDYYDAEI